ncbi:MAG TPA: DEAD/DEAH box helicase [Kiritimatiellia bacterium]|nr:DEAD/DEAH box helicase [Kiritimatiellia bacterium]HMO98774.1 DEAD/DEAH box helicase [Kiritimatiellia bacterium]HMP97975.1 DEAD/DEAH box helicase [Kiritimatiellia bacterium]
MKQEIPFTFDAFGFNDALIRGIREAGFRQPSPIQEAVIPLILQGRDLIAQAHTGTGKTAAFCLPAMQRMHQRGGVELLVIAPTRELAAQVSDEIYKLGHHAGVRSVAVTGGQSYTRQLKLANGGCQAVVATPGRMLDLLKSGQLKNFKPSVIVLDEADEMLDMGFLDDVKAIFSFLPQDRQTLLFSATMPDPIRKLAEATLRDPAHIKTHGAHESANKDIQQRYFVVEEEERKEAVVRLIEDLDPEKAIVFCRTRLEVDELCMFLGTRGFLAQALHGDMEQAARNKVMAGFRRGDFELLVATDVAARGLDVAEVSLVFNYHIPFDSKSYIHRIGRTGRAGRKGLALTLVTPREYRQIEYIQRDTGSRMEAGHIPNRRTLRLNRLARLRDQLADAKVAEEAREVTRSFQDDYPPEELAARLLSMMLGQQNESGPDAIGIHPDEHHRLRAGPRKKPYRFGRPAGAQGKSRPWAKKKFKKKP